MKPFNSRPENAAMRTFLASHGIECKVMFIWNGSLKGSWRLYGSGQKWTPELWEKLNGLGFLDFDGKPLGQFSGNGGEFSIFARCYYPERFLKGVTPPKNCTLRLPDLIPA